MSMSIKNKNMSQLIYKNAQTLIIKQVHDFYNYIPLHLKLKNSFKL